MQKERVSIFIDGSNLYHGLKSMGIRKINFEEFAKLIAGNRELQCVFYYTAMMDKDFDAERFAKHQRFLQKLSSIPKFKIVFCTFKKIIENSGKIRYEIKGDAGGTTYP